MIIVNPPTCRAHALVFVVFIGAIRRAVTEILYGDTVSIGTLEGMPGGTVYCKNSTLQLQYSIANLYLFLIFKKYISTLQLLFTKIRLQLRSSITVYQITMKTSFL